MNQNGDPILQIIEDVAVKHGLALDRDDPVLVIYTINQHLMQSSACIQQAMLEQCRKDMEANMGLWKARLGRQGDEAIRMTLDATREVIISAVRMETEAALKALTADLQKHQRSTSLNIFASVLALAASAIVLWVALPL
jgi:Transcriptional activator TraM